jgi:hypothetical protein
MERLLSDIPTLDPTTKWLLVVAVGLTIFYAVFRPMRKKKDPLEKSPSRPGLYSQRAVERDMSNLLVELSEMARQVTAQLDTRTLKLEMLLKEADERIAALKALGEHPPQQNGNGTAADPAALPAPPSPAPVAAPAAPTIDPRHLEIYEMADQSLTSQQIAVKLSRPRAEVDLILALRGKKKRV